MLGKPLLAASLSFALLRFLPDARLFIKSTPFEFPEQALTGQLFLGDLQRFFYIIIKDLDFHNLSVSNPFDYLALQLLRLSIGAGVYHSPLSSTRLCSMSFTRRRMSSVNS